MASTAKQSDKLLAKLDGLLDQAVMVVPRPRDNFAAAVRAMHDARGTATIPSTRWRELDREVRGIVRILIEKTVQRR